ncbi:hypothetical protein N7513_000599 [Penicillium frequentans]|nr:hypothetical protein N7513_000599 [Penicillium glabrum]
MTEVGLDAEESFVERTVSAYDNPGIPYEVASTIPDKRRSKWREIIIGFSPSWFTACMGTGIVAVLFYFIPFEERWLYYLSIILFIFDAILFCVISFITILRYALEPTLWRATLTDPAIAPFLGTIPIAFVILIELWVFICVPLWGEWASTLAWVCWIVDAIFAVIITTSLSFQLMSKSHLDSLKMVTAVQLLPIASTVIASGVGAEVAGVLPSHGRAQATLVASFVLWGMAMPLSGIILIIYYQRLAVHKLPSREVIVSCFLPLSPLGFGSYSIMYMGKVARSLLADSEPAIAIAGEVAFMFCMLIGLIIWSFGLTWFAFALASIYHSWPFPFNMGWWGFTFPLGVFAASTIELGLGMSSLFFRVLGTVFSAIVIVLWIVVSLGTLRGLWKRSLLVAPVIPVILREEPIPSDGFSSDFW